MKSLISFRTCLFLLLMNQPVSLKAQKILVKMYGETTLTEFFDTYSQRMYEIGPNCIEGVIEPIPIYCCPVGDEIRSVGYCELNQQDIFYVVLKSGVTVRVNATTGIITVTGFTPNLGGHPPEEIAGDDAYVISYDMVNKSSDSLATWVVDTLGLHGAYNWSVCVDTFQNVYLATGAGLFSQTQTGNTWVKNNNLPGTFGAELVYTDRRNRMFVAVPGPQRLYKSTDLGTSFQIDTAGIGNQKVLSVGDDAFGNIYVVLNSQGYLSTGDRIYRSLGGTLPFTRIDLPLTALNLDSSYINPYNSVSGDTVLLAATTYGLFRSNDHGDTWIETDNGNSVQSFSGIAKANNGKMLVTTTQGCFRSTDATDTSWNKVYPVNGFAGNQPLYKDNSGTLYTRGAILFSDFNSQTRMIVKSTDNGATWLPDTLGIYQIHMFTWFVDENGVQHAAQFGNGTAPIQLFAKQPGQSWMPDNAGYTSPNDAAPIIFGSNGLDKIYFSQTGNVVWSKQGSANWMPDTTGLNDGVYWFTSDSTHTVYAGAFTGVWKQNANNSWTKLNSPPSPGGNTLSAFAITIDNQNKLWAGFSYFDIYFNAVGIGVFYTTDDGATWQQPSFQIDTVTFLQLVAIGDSVYGLSYYNGAYLFDNNANSGIHLVGLKNDLLHIYPDPATDQVHISLSGKENYTIKVFTTLGNEIVSFTTSKPDNILQTANWNSGIYFIEVNTENFQEVKKVVKE